MAFQNIYFLHYNNYYNRIVKREKSLDDYRLYQVGDPLLETNFNPNDGVNTVHFVNWEPQIPETMPDYCVIQEIEGGQINSCWFVIEAVRTLQGQMRFTLRRDLIADFYDEVTSATSFIEKATLSPSDPFIFNREDFTVNQIKKGEHLLKDPGGIAWIVGYLAENITETNVEEPLSFQPYETKARSDFDGLNTIPGGIRGKVTNATIDVISSVEFEFATTSFVKFSFWGGIKKPTGINGESGYSLYQAAYSDTGILFTARKTDTDLMSDASNKLVRGSLRYSSGMQENIESLCGARDQSDLLRYNGKILLDSDSGNYYKVSVTRNADIQIDAQAPDNSVIKNNTKSIIEAAISDGAELEISNDTLAGIRYRASVESYTVSTYSFSPGKVYLTIHGSREKLRDAPYTMFAIPYQETNIYGNGRALQANPEYSFAAAQAIAKKFQSSGSLYDLQILPYCPLQDVVKNGGIDLTGLEERVDFSDILYISPEEGASAERVSVILWANRSSFTFNIPHNIEISDPKIENQCDFHRLCSPNYSGIFEFSAAKNGGVSFFNVDCTYKPISPYIHLNPDFGGLYGSDWNDTRGLVCTGDFSVATISDAWEAYQIQNKNFSEIFARQISNMEVNNAVQREREIWGAAAGAVGAGTSGGITGAISGGGAIGAIAGATIGGGLSAIAGARDVQLSDQLRSEALDYTRDMYGYNLGNIQALPYGLAKTSAITANNKLFPFLEYYSCTDEEKQAFRDKLKYNGMTVMRIGQIGRYLQLEKTYIKARIIRMENLTDEFHLLNEIAAEMAKGVFI